VGYWWVGGQAINRQLLFVCPFAPLCSSLAVALLLQTLMLTSQMHTQGPHPSAGCEVYGQSVMAVRNMIMGGGGSQERHTRPSAVGALAPSSFATGAAAADTYAAPSTARTVRPKVRSKLL
jgi:hypothetical protein